MMGAKERGLSSRQHFCGGVDVAGQSVAGGVNDPFERSGRTLVGRDDEIVETHVFARAVFLVAIGLRPVRKLEGSGGGRPGLGHQRLSGCAPEVVYYMYRVLLQPREKAKQLRRNARQI